MTKVKDGPPKKRGGSQAAKNAPTKAAPAKEVTAKKATTTKKATATKRETISLPKAMLPSEATAEIDRLKAVLKRIGNRRFSEAAFHKSQYEARQALK